MPEALASTFFPKTWTEPTATSKWSRPNWQRKLRSTSRRWSTTFPNAPVPTFTCTVYSTWRRTPSFLSPTGCMMIFAGWSPHNLGGRFRGVPCCRSREKWSHDAIILPESGKWSEHPCYRNSFTYSSKTYIRPRCAPVISRTMPLLSNASMSE